MKRLTKFSADVASPDPAPYLYPHVWRRESTNGNDRLVVAPAGGHIDLLLALLGDFEGPFGLLYVLAVSRSGTERGRYDRYPLSRDDVNEVLIEFQAHFEQDGRHEIWITDAATNSTFVYDKHDLIYCYGDLGPCERRLVEVGLARGKFQIPSPHTHHFHATFDEAERELVGRWEWRRSPLSDTDQD